MKKTCFINGSPRGKNSGSQYLIKHLENDLDKQDNKSFTIYTSDLQGKDISSEDFEKIISVDNIVFAFPLYVDSIPANLLDFLFKLEAFLQKRKEINKDKTLPRIDMILHK